MKTKQKRTKVAVSILVLAGLVVFGLTAIGGNLEPSVPPGSTMKTLDEVEPRIPIPGSATPCGTFTISQSGSYYLSGDRLASGTGITIDANNVTIDLMGYSLIGPGSGTNYGIYMNGRRNVEIRNGTVRNFGSHGIYEASSNGKNHRVISVRAVSNGGAGILVGGLSQLVKDCTAADNTGYFGISASNGSTVTGNTCYNNGYGGISAGRGTVTGNTCYDNGGHGIYAAYANTITGNTTYSNTDYGIYANSYCLVDQNTAYGNGTNIYAGGGCVLGTNCAP